MGDIVSIDGINRSVFKVYHIDLYHRFDDDGKMFFERWFSMHDGREKEIYTIGNSATVKRMAGSMSLIYTKEQFEQKKKLFEKRMGIINRIVSTPALDNFDFVSSVRFNFAEAKFEVVLSEQ